MATIPVQRGTTILDEVESVYDDITKRAYEKSLSRGSSVTIDIDDWLEAEREMLMKPEARLVEKLGHFIVRLYLPQIDPANVRILATTDDLVIHSSGGSPGTRVFKTLHFPSPIDLRKVRSNWVHNRLIVVALKAGINEVSAAGTARVASGGSHTGRR